MVRYVIVLLMSCTFLFSQNIYERSCVSCHKDLPTSLQRMFMGYLLVYGGEKNFKAGLKHYLQYPSKHISVMTPLFTDSYGIKKKTKLSSEQIDNALDIYWDTYKVFGKLK